MKVKFYSILKENIGLLEAGFSNPRKQIENASFFGVPVVFALNRFATDSELEVETCLQLAREAGAVDAVCSSHWFATILTVQLMTLDVVQINISLLFSARNIFKTLIFICGKLSLLDSFGKVFELLLPN